MGGFGGVSSARLAREVLLGDGSVAQLARAEIEREVGRSRRYGGAVTLCLVEFEGTIASEAPWKDVATVLREWDRSWAADRSGLILLPNTDANGARVALDRIFSIAEASDLSARVRIATFPDDAPTVDGLVSHLIETRMERSA